MTTDVWFLYLLHCADGTLYTGVTTDVERRVAQHNAGRGSHYTAARRPVWPVAAWRFADRSSAQQAEAQLRRRSHQEKERLALSGEPFGQAPFCGPSVPRFCPRCGGALQVEMAAEESPRRVCRDCGRVHYQNAKPCAGVLATRDDRLLLVRRGIEPYRGCWDIPGGFIEQDELPQEAARREVREETGLEVDLTGLLGFYLDRYLYQGEQGVTLNVYFLARVVGGQERAGDDAAELGWFAADELPARVAFVHARQVLDDWRRWDRDERRTTDDESHL